MLNMQKQQEKYILTIKLHIIFWKQKKHTQKSVVGSILYKCLFVYSKKRVVFIQIIVYESEWLELTITSESI